MNSHTLPGNEKLSLKEELLDIRNRILPIILILEKLDRVRNMHLNKLLSLRSRYAEVDRKLAFATKLTVVNKKSKDKEGTETLESILNDPEKAKKLMTLLKKEMEA